MVFALRLGPWVFIWDRGSHENKELNSGQDRVISLRSKSFFVLSWYVEATILLPNQLNGKLILLTMYYVSKLVLFHSLTTDNWLTFSNICMCKARFLLGENTTHISIYWHIVLCMLFHWWQWHLGTECVNSRQTTSCFPHET